MDNLELGKNISPGEFIRTKIKTAGQKITQETLAASLLVTRLTVHNILNGKSAVTPDIALRLEAVLGLSALELLILQSKYDLFNHKQKIIHTLKNIRPLADLS